MALVGDTLYVANADALVKVPYRAGDIAIAAVPEEVIALPGRGRSNHHRTKSLPASRDDSRLYVVVGSHRNAADHGIAVEVDSAAILEIAPPEPPKRMFALGQRHPIRTTWHPLTRSI